VFGVPKIAIIKDSKPNTFLDSFSIKEIDNFDTGVGLEDAPELDSKDIYSGDLGLNVGQITDPDKKFADLALVRNRDKTAQDAFRAKNNARYFKQFFEGEGDEQEKKQWWGNY
jgi:hypothetical protein